MSLTFSPLSGGSGGSTLNEGAVEKNMVVVNGVRGGGAAGLQQW